MAEHLRHFRRDEGVVFVGKAQENTPVFRHRTAPQSANGSATSVDRAARSAMVNNYYICAVDRDFGPFFLKFLQLFSVQCHRRVEAPEQRVVSGASPRSMRYCANGCGCCRTPAVAAES